MQHSTPKHHLLSIDLLASYHLLASDLEPVTAWHLVCILTFSHLPQHLHHPDPPLSAARSHPHFIIIYKHPQEWPIKECPNDPEKSNQRIQFEIHLSKIIESGHRLEDVMPTLSDAVRERMVGRDELDGSDPVEGIQLDIGNVERYLISLSFGSGS